MARTGSTTAGAERATRSTRGRRTAETPAVEVENTEVPAENDGDIPGTEVVETEPTEAKEASAMSTDTVEPEVSETTVSDTEATPGTPEDAEKAAADKAAAEKAAKEAEEKFDAFKAVVATALAERDNSTGTLPVEQVENVKASYRDLAGAKAKHAARSFLTDQMREAVNNTDIILGSAVMTLADAVLNAGPSPKVPTERKPVDVAATYRDRIATLHLAYSLARGDVPEGVDADAELAKVEAQVSELMTAAENYFAWVKSTDEDKGDEPTVDQLVKRAVKAAQGKAAGRVTSSASTGTSTPRVSDGVRRNVRTHIAQAFEALGLGVGDFAKVSAIAKQATAEYPDGSCSPGAISAALKSEKGVEGFQLALDENGHAGAKKL